MQLIEKVGKKVRDYAVHLRVSRFRISGLRQNGLGHRQGRLISRVRASYPGINDGPQRGKSECAVRISAPPLNASSRSDTIVPGERSRVEFPGDNTEPREILPSA